MVSNKEHNHATASTGTYIKTADRGASTEPSSVDNYLEDCQFVGAHCL